MPFICAASGGKAAAELATIPEDYPEVPPACPGPFLILTIWGRNETVEEGNLLSAGYKAGPGLSAAGAPGRLQAD